MQWIERPPGVQEVMGLIPVRDSDFSLFHARVMLISSLFTVISFHLALFCTACCALSHVSFTSLSSALTVRRQVAFSPDQAIFAVWYLTQGNSFLRTWLSHPTCLRLMPTQCYGNQFFCKGPPRSCLADLFVAVAAFCKHWSGHFL